MATSLIKAYVTVEYIDPARDVKAKKVFKGYTFSPENDWKALVPSAVAEVAIEFPQVFKVHLDESPAALDANDIARLDEKIALLADELHEHITKSKGGRPPKENEG